MYKTTEIKTDNKITVDINGLMGMLSVGRQTAEQIATAAGAGLKVGRRKLYRVDKITAYLDELQADTEQAAVKGA
jgi:hypothetical protein